ncbi:MAG TPA: MGMT family protein [Cycloclasticus sp.]|nr:MGMT family protein [Cycloclasticus sp.]
MSINPRYKKIWVVVKSIPKGSVSTYGDVARFSGYPGCARMVGTALRAAPDELNVPWHRVINSQGKVSFPSGGEKATSQQDILEHEGVVFLSGVVNLNAYAWQGNLDSELWRM